MLNAVSYQEHSPPATLAASVNPANRPKNTKEIDAKEDPYRLSTNRIKNVLRKDEEKQKNEGLPFQNPLEGENPNYQFANAETPKTENVEDYKNPNADEEGDDVIVGAEFSSDEIIDLDDTSDKHSAGKDHPQKVSIEAFFGGNSVKNNPKVIINMGEKDEIAYIAEAKVTAIEPLKDKKVKLYLAQDDLLNKVSRTVELIFPEESLERIYNGLDGKQQEGFQNALYESEKKGKFIPNSEKIPRTSQLVQLKLERESQGDT
jgi:hypothetical protein